MFEGMSRKIEFALGGTSFELGFRRVILGDDGGAGKK